MHRSFPRPNSGLDWLREGFVFLYDVIDQKPRFGLRGFAAGMWRLGWDLECLAGLDYPRRLTLDRQFPTATFDDVTRLDPGMRVTRNSYTWLNGNVHYYGRVAWDRAVNLQQDFTRNPT
jgi:hypothetical protein